MALLFFVNTSSSCGSEYQCEGQGHTVNELMFICLSIWFTYMFLDNVGVPVYAANYALLPLMCG